MQLDKSVELLSNIIVYMKYAKYVPELKRRETWGEIVTRNKNMHLEKFPFLRDEINEAYEYVYQKKILPSMRSMQFAGKPIAVNPARMFNCSYLPIDNVVAFSEVMFLLLSGCGVGYSVQKHHVEQLPEIRKPLKKRRFLIADSIEGWSDAIKALINAYMGGKSMPNFDFSDIREKGALLITSGGKAPGPEPLKKCLFNIQCILDRKNDGEKLNPLECHDILCFIADAVLAGGIRRSAMIAFFNMDDEEMITCKYGDWWETNPQRARANNSAVVLLSRIKEKEFWKLFRRIQESGSGDPGIFFTNDVEMLANPCVEAGLRKLTFCNLVEINASLIKTQQEFNECSHAASFINTLQASYTDFHYLRDEWKINTEKDALIGVGLAGLANENFLSLNFEEAAEIVKKTNEETALKIGINPAARCCVIKPGGTGPLVLGSSSGVHSWHDDYYLKNIRVGKDEPIYNFLLKNLPEIVEDEILKPDIQAIISIPIKAPNGAITRNESINNFLERVKKMNLEWVRNGYRSGPNNHNVSATVSVKNGEWDELGKWMWENRNNYHGLAVLPYYGGTHKQLPLQSITEEEFNKLYNKLKDINFNEITEYEDTTNLQGELACAGGSCGII